MNYKMKHRNQFTSYTFQSKYQMYDEMSFNSLWPSDIIYYDKDLGQFWLR